MMHQSNEWSKLRTRLVCALHCISPSSFLVGKWRIEWKTYCALAESKSVTTANNKCVVKFNLIVRRSLDASQMRCALRLSLSPGVCIECALQVFGTTVLSRESSRSRNSSTNHKRNLIDFYFLSRCRRTRVHRTTSTTKLPKPITNELRAFFPLATIYMSIFAVQRHTCWQ